MTQAFPLQWPHTRPREPAGRRKAGKFGSRRGNRSTQPLSIAEALVRLQRELDRIGAGYTVVSSNVALRLDGKPRSGMPEPDDTGVAVYFDLDGKQHCLPCDTYNVVSDNIAAIAAHIEATRAIERHGVASVAEMFSGFAQLPAPGHVPWWSTLQVEPTATKADIDAAYKRLARERHPDNGGSTAMMADLNVARDKAIEDVTA